MDKISLFESILKDSEIKTSKIHKSIFKHIYEQTEISDDLGKFKYVEEYDHDYTYSNRLYQEGGFISTGYAIKDTHYGIAITIIIDNITMDDSGRYYDDVLVENTTITPGEVLYDVVDYDDGGYAILQEATAEDEISFLAERGITVTMEDLEKLKKDTLLRAEAECTNEAEENPESYFCNYDCDRWGIY